MPRSLVDLLRAHAETSPEAEALWQDGRALTYAELWRAARGLAGHLLEHGLQSEDRVVLVLDNGIDYVIAYYAVLAAGGAVVALNPAARAPELAAAIDHSGGSWLLHPPRQAELERFPPDLLGRLRRICVGPAAPEWRSALTQRPPAELPRLERDDLAAIIYTSGTTGAPKGVMLSHGNLLSNVRAVVSYLQLHADDRVLHALPFSYSYGNSVLHTHIAAGASVVIESGLMYPHRLLERIVEQRCTGFSGVPTTFALLLQRTRLDAYDLSTLRYLTQAGAALPIAQARRLSAALPHLELFVMYGQTEATARLSYLPPEHLHDKPGSVGIPVPGTEIVIRGAAGEPMPPGQAGEICVRGPHVMLGYWRDPQATAEVLRDGWLHTGDLGYMDADGYLYIEGRASELIKSGAHRISPLEIEAVIAQIEGVAEVAVVGMPDSLLGQAVKAVVVVQPGSTVSAREILAHCRRQLASYKLPKQVEFAAALPKTSSGKLQRRALQQDTEHTRQVAAG